MSVEAARRLRPRTHTANKRRCRQRRRQPTSSSPLGNPRLRELRQAKPLQELGLDRRSLRIEDIGAEGLTDDRARRTCTFGLLDDTADRLRYIMRVRRILALKGGCNRLRDLLRDRSEISISVNARRVVGNLCACEDARRVAARLD